MKLSIRLTSPNSVLSYLRVAFAGTLISTAAAMALFAAKPGPTPGANANPKNGVYIVQMLAAPAVAYTGDVAGYNATKPRQGQKIDPLASDTVRYIGYLKGRHDEALRQVGGGKKIYDYAISYNGFAAKLTGKQATAMAKQPGVVAVTPDELVNQDTSTTPHFLGLDATGGLWDQLGGATGSKKGPGAGEGIIIGVIDSGIWPESKSFTDRDATGRLVYQQIPGFNGKCDSAERVIDPTWDANRCNKKLIAAQHFNAGWGGDAALEADRPWEFMSPRDYNGHGSHTTSTSGGNNGVQPTGPAAGFTPISGMAPRARVAMYKALWSTEDASTASGLTSDLVAAIDQAVSDGVDVINYSISGTTTNFADPVQVSFLFAADAGVFVSASAGNSGPTTGTVAHPGPWLTTVAAGTHNRNGFGSVTLGNGVTYPGASIAGPVGPAPFIRSTDAGLSGADPEAVRLCFTEGDNVALADGTGPVLDPAKIAGKIVLCDRGVNGRVNKSLAVSDAGGVGMVLVNTSPNSLNADFHFVPTVHVADTNRAALIAYAATVNPTAKINQSTITTTDPAPFTASFSSRGPLTAGGGDLLKPDVIAPGQDILAAVAPPGNHGFDFNLYSGTSMSAPHVAGVAALLKQLHPTWTPMMVKSALMTSGYDVLDGSNTNPVVIFRQGAGHIQPNSAADPGLVYNSGFNDWLAFLCGTTTAVGPGTCNALVGLGYSLDPSDLNVASIAIGDLAGVQTIKRKVTNVGSSTATYTASTTGLTGITVNINPSSLTLNPGQTKSYTVTFTRTTATLNAYSTGSSGQLTWTDGTHSVRTPVVLRPVAIAAPREVTGTASGISYSVKTGYAGTLNFAARGLVAATTTNTSVAQDPDQTFNPTDSTGTYSKTINVPAGLKLFRVGIDESSITPSGTDLDVYVYVGSTLVGASADGDSNELVSFVDPPAGNYTVYVHGFNTAGPSANFTLYEWQLGTANAANMTVPAPATATVGGTIPVNLSFSGLAGGTWYLGQVVYNDGSSDIGTTIVNVK
jgi:subtilisin family serine protease